MIRLEKPSIHPRVYCVEQTLARDARLSEHQEEEMSIDIGVPDLENPSKQADNDMENIEAKDAFSAPNNQRRVKSK